MNVLLVSVIITISSLLACAHPADRSDSNTYIPITGSAWRITLADVTGDGVNELIYGAYEGAVRCQDLSNNALLWELPVQGFPFAVCAADANHDGKAETYAVTADGYLYAIDADGRMLWTFQSKHALYDVRTGDVKPGGNLEIICGGIDRHLYVLRLDGAVLADTEIARKLIHRLAAGNLDDDAAAEIYAAVDNTSLAAYKLRNGALEQVWKTSLKVPESRRGWGNPNALFHPYALVAADLDDDGRDEAVLGDSYWNSQSAMMVDASGTSQWITDRLTYENTGPTYNEVFATGFVRSGDVDPRIPGLETVTVQGSAVEMVDAQGQRLGYAESLLGFTDLALDGHLLYLSSTPNGDNRVYRIDLSRDWETAVANLERQGLARDIGGTLETIRQQVLTYAGRSIPYTKTINFQPEHDETTGSIPPTPEGLASHKARVGWFKQQFPYDNQRFVEMMRFIEPEPPLDERGQPWSPSRWKTDAVRGTMSVDEILAAARFIEEHKIPTIVQMGHSTMPFITLKTAEKVLLAAPTALVAFRSAEDEQHEVAPRYARHYFGPLQDLCLRYGGRKVIPLNKGLWWISMPAQKAIFSELFKGDRRRTVYGSTEDSNSRTPEINLMGRAGVWMAGLMDDWCASLIGDLFTSTRYHQWEYPKHGHPFLRLLLAHTLMGANHYRFNIPHFYRNGDTFGFVDQGRESIEIFLHMLGKGIIAPPRRDQVAGFSRVGVVMHEAPEKWIIDAHNGHNPEIWVDDPEMHNAVIPHNGELWGRTTTPAHALQRVLLEKDRQFGYHVPATPYGPFVIVPAYADLTKVPFVEEWWHTDGIYAWKEGGAKLTGMAAAQAIQTDFERAAAKLPFRATGGVFFQSIKMDTGGYRLYAVDSGWLDPQDRDVTLRVQLPGKWRLTDILSGEAIPVNNGIAKFVCPAGAFRIIDAVQ